MDSIERDQPPIPDVFQINKLDLIELPKIRDKDPEITKRLLKGVLLFEETTGVNLGDTAKEKLRHIEQDTTGLNNKNFLIRGEGNKPIARIKVYKKENPYADGSTRCERESTALVQIAKYLKAENDRTTVPKFIAVDEDEQILVMSHEFTNLSASGEPFMASILDAIQDFKNIETSKEDFPFRNTVEKTKPADYVKFASERIEKFFDFANNKGKLKRSGQFSDLEKKDYERLMGIIGNRKILEGITAERKKIEMLSASSLFNKRSPNEHRSSTPSDGLMDNFLFRKLKGGKNTLSVVDHEYFSTDQDRLFFVAMLAQNPLNRKHFKSDEEMKDIMSRFISDYVRAEGFNQEEVDRFNLLLPIAHYAWLASILSRFYNPTSIRELTGEAYRSWAEYIIEERLPIVEKMIKEDPFKFQYKGELSLKSISRENGLRELSYPLTSEAPSTIFEIFVSEKVEDPVQWMTSINSELEKNNLPQFSREEVFGNPPFLLGKTKSIEHLGSGVYLVMSEFYTTASDKNEPLLYGWICKDKNTAEQENGLIFAYDTTENVDEGKLKGNKPTRYEVPQELLESAIKKSKDPQRFRFFRQGFKYHKQLSDTPPEKVETLTNVEINETNVDYESILIFTDSQGKKLPFVVNRLGEDNAEGSGYMCVTPEGKYRMQLNTRVITLPANNATETRKEQIEAPRQFDQSWAGLSRELHISPEEIQVIGTTNIAADTHVEVNSTYCYLVKTEIGYKYAPKPSINNSDGNTSNVTDEIRFIDLTGTEILEAIENGLIKDSATIAMIAAFFSRYTNEVELTAEAENIVIFMSETYPTHEGGRKRRDILRGNINTGNTIRKMQQNSGAWRNDFSVNSQNIENFLSTRVTSEEIIPVSARAVFEGFGRGEFDQTTTAALFIGMLHKGLIKSKGIKPYMS